MRSSQALADLSLLCLWPFGNSLTETVHSEFYQCHTQDRSHTLRPADPAGRSAALSWRPPSLHTQKDSWRFYNLPPPPTAVIPSLATLLTSPSAAPCCILAQSDLQEDKDKRGERLMSWVCRRQQSFPSHPKGSHPNTIAQTRHLFAKVSKQLSDPHDLSCWTSPTSKWAVTRTSNVLLVAS